VFFSVLDLQLRATAFYAGACSQFFSRNASAAPSNSCSGTIHLSQVCSKQQGPDAAEYRPVWHRLRTAEPWLLTSYPTNYLVLILWPRSFESPDGKPPLPLLAQMRRSDRRSLIPPEGISQYLRCYARNVSVSRGMSLPPLAPLKIDNEAASAGTCLPQRAPYRQKPTSKQVQEYHEKRTSKQVQEKMKTDAATLSVGLLRKMTASSSQNCYGADDGWGGGEGSVSFQCNNGYRQQRLTQCNINARLTQQIS